MLQKNNLKNSIHDRSLAFGVIILVVLQQMFSYLHWIHHECADQTLQNLKSSNSRQEGGGGGEILISRKARIFIFVIEMVNFKVSHKVTFLKCRQVLKKMLPKLFFFRILVFFYFWGIRNRELILDRFFGTAVVEICTEK